MARLSVVHVASELSPFAHTGGLGQAVASLARAQAAAGHKVGVFLPYYREARLLGLPALQPVFTNIPVHVAPGIRQEVSLLSAPLPGSKVTVYLVDHPKSYDRDQLYGTPDGDYADNADRFILLCRVALQAVKELKEEIDVLHAHDWQAALAPCYLKRVYAGESVFTRTGCVFTVHNLAYQGVFLKETVVRTGLGWEAFTPDLLEFFGKVNLMKAGILFADRLTTVSPTYAKEITTPAGGFGLDGLLRSRESVLSGVLNGIDVEEWDPAKDRSLPATYSRRNVAGKAACKEALLGEVGLPPAPKSGTMLVGAVARLAEQKGFDLLVQALPKLARKPVQFVLLGTGDRAIQESLEDASRRYPGVLALRVKFDPGLARRIYAGADAYLMPSRYEPCGLGQMIALRYGTLPIARATGGLVDTITPVDLRRKQGTGFLFEDHEPEALVAAVGEALNAFSDDGLWKKLVGEAMSEDVSWGASVRRYDQIYADAIKKRARR